MAKRRLKHGYRRVIILVTTLIFLAVAAKVGLWAYSEYDYRYGKVVLTNTTLKITQSDANPKAVATLLQKEGVINSTQEFMDIANQQNFHSVSEGNYSFAVGESYRQLFNKLRLGHQTPVRVTFNNIRTLEQLAGVLGRQLMADSSDFLLCFKNEASVEGLSYIARFIPNTYEFYWTVTPKEFSDKMKGEFEKFWSDDNRTQKAAKLQLTPEQIVIIASIVDEETNAQSEMDEVAGVYINRLRIGMPLQADPTVKFAMGDFSIRRILNKHLEYDSPYNTYKYSGLPPGVICAPSIAAIDGTLNYADAPHKYYYFCANADFSGTHKFASSLKEHNSNARAYQRELSRRGIR